MLKISKKQVLSIAVASLVTTGAIAGVPGPYVGGQLGWGNTHEGSIDNIGTNRSNKDTGLAGRAFAGYQINQNVAVEGGFTRFANSTAKASGPSVLGPINVSATVKTYAVDLVGKGIIPLQNGFSLYGKAGVAYLYADGSATAKVGTQSAKASQSEHNYYPTAGVGVSYDITPNLVADVSYSRIQKVGNSSKNLPSTDFVGAGLAYNFG